MKKELRTTFNPRQYMLSNDFEIYYYSDTNMKNIVHHSHTYYEFYFFVGGSVSINIDGIEHPYTPKEKQSLYQNLISYIDAHLDEELSLDHLAHIFFVSKYHISHVFKENIGLSVYQYVLKKRLSMCRDAIITNSKISETYLQYGFKDYSSFYRAFKKEYGISPSDYQKLYTYKLPFNSGN